MRLRAADVCGLDFGCREKGGRIAVLALHHLGFGAQAIHAARAMCNFQVAGLDCVAFGAGRDEVAYGAHRLQRLPEYKARGFASPQVDRATPGMAPDRRTRESAVAAAAAPAAAIGFQHHRLDAVGARQKVGTRETCVTAADDGDTVSACAAILRRPCG